MPEVGPLDQDAYRTLAQRFGTPLFVYDGASLTGSLRRLQQALHPSLEVFYSLKANPNISIFSLLCGHGARAEVSSLVELNTAVRAGAAPEDIIFLGPGKSAEELAACLDTGIYAIVVESFPELAELDAMARSAGVRPRVLLRVNPSHAAPGSRLAMGGKPRQFGIDEDQLLSTSDLPARYPALRLAGVHGYLGTRILDPATVIANTAHVLELAERVAARTGIPLDAVDVGGGLGVAYFDGETDPDLAVLAQGMYPLIERFHQRHPRTRLLFESGRYLAAAAGTYVVRVRYVKDSMGTQFAITDGGTHHHMAAVGIGSFVKRNFPVALLDRTAEADERPWTLTGPLCTPNDTIAKDAVLPALRPGDLIGIARSGAYGPTASPVLFLSHGFPAEVLIHEGQTLLIRDRDEPDDLLRKQHHHQFTKEEQYPWIAAKP